MMNQYIERLRQSLTLRTLYGLIALGCLLGFSLLGRLESVAQQAAATRASVDMRLTRQGGSVDEALWLERAEMSEQALAQWRELHWSGATAGVIAAELQNAVNRIATEAQLNVVSVNIDPAPIVTPDGSILRFRFSTESRNGESVAKALAALSAHKPIIVVDETNTVFDEQTRGRFSASGYAPVSIAQPQQGDS